MCGKARSLVREALLGLKVNSGSSSLSRVAKASAGRRRVGDGVARFLLVRIAPLIRVDRLLLLSVLNILKCSAVSIPLCSESHDHDQTQRDSRLRSRFRDTASQSPSNNQFFCLGCTCYSLCDAISWNLCLETRRIRTTNIVG